MANTISPFSGTPDSSVERSPSQPILTMQRPSTALSAQPKTTKSKPRKRVNTAEKRNQHNAIERQRRETLNGKFLGLARLLPALASHRRPSKSAIVNGSISHLTFQRDQRLLASRLLRQLCAERDSLMKECNEWRAASGFAPKDSRSAWSDEMEEVCNVEKEVFGNFATMQEDDGDDQDQDNQDGSDGPDGQDFGGNDLNESLGLGLGFGARQDMTLEQATIVAANNVGFNPLTGLITPRSSTDIDPLAHAFNMPNLKVQQSIIPALPQTQSIPIAQNGQQRGQQGGISWADFVFTKPELVTPGSTNLPFTAFVADNLESPSGCSPANSNSGHSLHSSQGQQSQMQQSFHSALNNGMPTPPTTAEFSGSFMHTPSPRSSQSDQDAVQPRAQQQQQQQQPWTEQQLLFLHSVQQQQLQQRQQAQASFLQAQVQAQAAQAQQNHGIFNPALNSFSMFPQQLASRMGQQGSVGNAWEQMIGINGLSQVPVKGF